jgi:hypothetical protein
VPGVVAAVLLCLGVLLPLFVVGSEGSSALGMANVLRVDRVANGTAPSQDGTSLFFVPAEETDDSPVNAGLLTRLFLAASFFGVSARGLLTNEAQGGAQCSLQCSSLGEVVGGTREDRLPFLGVFRL